MDGIPYGISISQTKSRYSFGELPRTFLPTAEYLSRKKILPEPICQICKMGIKDVFHALIECEVAKKIQKYTHANAEIQGVAREDVLSVMLNLGKKLPKKELEYVVAIWQVAWHARNKLIFQGKRLNPLILICKSYYSYGGFSKHTWEGTHEHQEQISQQTRTIESTTYRPL